MTVEDKDKLYQEMKSNPGGYVVKPMKEGGGNNYFGDDMIKILTDDSIIKSSIIMEKIASPEFKAFILKDDKVTEETCVSEIGIYGIILSNETSVLINKSAGFLLRTKNISSEEGGVMSGFSAIDVPYLVDMNLDSIKTIEY
jgi:hypothetical protein